MDSRAPKIIAIAAVAGGGKTTVTSRLSQRLSGARALYFDDYDLIGPDHIIDWVERGADYNEWNIDPILADIGELTDTREVEYILLDYPFARLHDKLKSIDLTIFIDTPLDIAMARRLLRDYGEANQDALWDDLRFYLIKGRMGYESMLKTIKPNSDIVIDGSLTVDEIVHRLENEISALKQNHGCI